MTYLELLERIKDGTQPSTVMYKDSVCVFDWNGKEYINHRDPSDRLHTCMSDYELATNDFIKECR